MLNDILLLLVGIQTRLDSVDMKLAEISQTQSSQHESQNQLTARVTTIDQELYALRQGTVSTLCKITKHIQQTHSDVLKLQTTKFYTRITHLPKEILTLILSWIPYRRVSVFKRISKLFLECLQGKPFARLNLSRIQPAKLTTELHIRKWSTPETDVFLYPSDFQEVYYEKMYPVLEKFVLETNPYENNGVTKAIPTVFGFMKSLKHLSLDSIGLTGPLPISLFRSKTIESLYFDKVRLCQEIPPEIGEARLLEYLTMTRCGLRGKIPKEIGWLVKLKKLWMGYNHLSGSIPSEIGNLVELTSLSLFGNQLEGRFQVS
ncbi:UNVERIFIED_CONTAM: hypothetical protein HDU68_012184 [Siphonaria sp. JEL0065]|nr:hypothetical protein HDU68_012184 [Siphonaria sp. JEL0065]